jgi:hypothetical protein
MPNDPIYLLKPVFNFLDGLIRDQGDRLYIVFLYVCLGVIGWILSGGLRRRQVRRYSAVIVSLIVTCSPVKPPLLPPVTRESPERGQRLSDEQDSSAFAA